VMMSAKMTARVIAKDYAISTANAPKTLTEQPLNQPTITEVTKESSLVGD
jgi:hypothetical protein